MAEKPSRLTPTPQVLRELFLRSGNNCAMPKCQHVIIDSSGVMVGRICHIEAAMPNGHRFNKNMSNQQRRASTNLLLLCAGHHSQIDDKKTEAKWSVEKLKKIKKDHEAKFAGLDETLQLAFETEFADNTDQLEPAHPSSFVALELAIPDCKIKSHDDTKRLDQVARYVKRLSVVPKKERDFMRAVLKRYDKLGNQGYRVSIDADDLRSALGISAGKITAFGEAMARYDVGELTQVGKLSGDFWHIVLKNPCEYVTWTDILTFCTVRDVDIDRFIIDLSFDLLD